MKLITLAGLLTAALASAAAYSAPPEGRGGGKGGNEEPPAEFIPALAYFEELKTSKQLRLANRAGDQACMVLETPDGSPKLRGFVYHAASKKLAYSIGETGIYATSWAGDPCKVDAPSEVKSLSEGVHPEVMDFSPDGELLVWTEPVKDFTGLGSPYKIFIYDFQLDSVREVILDKWGGSRPEWGVDGEWSVGGIRFSPEFASSNELIFVGGPLDGSEGAYGSLFAYDIDEDIAPRKIVDGANIAFDLFISATNSETPGSGKIAFADLESKQVVQVSLSGVETGRFSGNEPALSCDDMELIYTAPARKNRSGWYIADVDGGNAELWSTGSVRWFDWYCPQ